MSQNGYEFAGTRLGVALRAPGGSPLTARPQVFQRITPRRVRPRSLPTERPASNASFPRSLGRSSIRRSPGPDPPPPSGVDQADDQSRRTHHPHAGLGSAGLDQVLSLKATRSRMELDKELSTGPAVESPLLGE